MSHNKSVYIFFLEVLLWLPFTFAFWYFLAAALTWPVTLITRLLLLQFWPDWFESVLQQGYMLEIGTHLQPLAADGVTLIPGAFFAFSVHPLLYSYSLPFFMALSFASPSAMGIRLKRIVFVWGLILVPAQIFSVIVSIFKTLLLDVQVSTSQLNPPTWSYDLVAVSFQFVTLILPPMLPIMLWMWLYREYLQQLAPQLRFPS